MKSRFASKLRSSFFFSLASAAASFFASFAPQHAHAYATYIRNEYVTCVACHQNPRGGGLLTPYGRGIGASQSFFAREYVEPDLAKSGFQRLVSAGGRVDHGALVRLLGLAEPGGQTDLFLMQADYLAAIRPVAGSDAFRLELQAGVPPKRVWDRGDSWPDNLILRRLVAAYRPQDGLEFDVGRDFLPVGINIANHTAWIRERNRRNVTDFPTQARVEYWNDNYQLTPFVYLPSWREDARDQERGGGLRGEYHLSKNATLGASGLLGLSPAITRQNYALFSRVGFATVAGVLAEYDLTFRGLRSSQGALDSTFTQHTAYVQPFYAPAEWIELGWIGEALSVSKPFDESAWRTGPTARFRIHQYLTFLADARGEYRENQKAGYEVFAQLIGAFL